MAATALEAAATLARGVQGMGVRIAWTIVVLMIVGAAVSALFRVATAPDRIKERRDMAKEVCVKAGGEWVSSGRDEVCKRG
jgi:hypothetical protein